MLSNLLISTLRRLKRNLSYLLLNVFGLALGIGCAVVIYSIVSYELSFDKHHQNYKQVYRIITGGSAAVPHPFGEALKEDFAFIDAVARLDYQWGGIIASWDGEKRLERFSESSGLFFASSDLFKVFSIESLSGELATAIKTPNSAVISDEWARKYFGEEASPDHIIGKTLTINSNLRVEIKGVFKSQPLTTDFPFQLIVHYDNLKELDADFENGRDWNSTSNGTNVYVLLKDGQPTTQLIASMPDFFYKYYGKSSEETPFLLQPLSDIHFNKRYESYGGSFMDKRLVTALVIVALCLLITCCINFVNLATAQAVTRSKEIGIRKVLGGKRGHFQIQFLLETWVITVAAAFVSLAIAEIFFVFLKEILGYKLSISFELHPDLLVFIVLTVLAITILAGLYPAIILSRQNPIFAIKSKLTGPATSGSSFLRRALVILQFSVSQALIIGTVVVLMQLRFIQSQPLGFDHHAVLTTYVPVQDATQIETLRNRLLTLNGVEGVTFSMGAPISGMNSNANFYLPEVGASDNHIANFKATDEYYIRFFDLKLLAGRNIKPTDSLKAAVANEQVLKVLGLKSPEDALGIKVKTGYGGDIEIVGVVRDFHVFTLHSGLKPVFVVYSPDEFYQLSVKLTTTGDAVKRLDNAIASIDEIWSETYPDFIFDYQFLDESIAERYKTEKNLSKLFLIFAGIAIFIGGLGLYGLISFLANQRTKEIGVRKVLGASMAEIVMIYSKETVALLGVAFVIAAPLTYWVMNNWLEDFEYHTPFSALIFVVAIMVSLAIALASTGYRSVLAARVNPVESLRSE